MRAALRVLSAVFVVAYPVALFLGLPRLGTKAIGLLLAAILLASLPFRLAGAKREHVLAIARLPLTVVLLLLAGVALNDPRLFLALPTLTSLLLLGQFAASLRTVPIAERFARAQEDELSSEQVAYCRAVTIVWCAFFVANAAVSAGLGLFAPLAWWAIYTGALGYGLVALLASAEYVVRKHRFRKYGSNPVDRVLSRLFPPLRSEPS